MCTNRTYCTVKVKVKGTVHVLPWYVLQMRAVLHVRYTRFTHVYRNPCKLSSTHGTCVHRDCVVHVQQYSRCGTHREVVVVDHRINSIVLCNNAWSIAQFLSSRSCFDCNVLKHCMPRRRCCTRWCSIPVRRLRSSSYLCRGCFEFQFKIPTW